MPADLGIYLVIDGSGSMSGQRKEVVDGVNDFISEQQADVKGSNDDVRFTLTTFDEKVMQVYDGEDISLVRPVTVRDTFIGGGTALYDALGRTLTNAEDAAADRNIVVIYTDGETWADREFDKDKIKDLIDRLEATGDWQFIFLGAEFNEFAEAADNVGIAAGMTVNTSKTRGGMAATWGAVSQTTNYYKSAPKADLADGLIVASAAAGVDWDAAKVVPTNVVEPITNRDPGDETDQ